MRVGRSVLLEVDGYQTQVCPEGRDLVSAEPVAPSLNLVADDNHVVLPSMFRAVVCPGYLLLINVELLVPLESYKDLV